jgi:hypothetical protein
VIERRDCGRVGHESGVGWEDITAKGDDGCRKDSGATIMDNYKSLFSYRKAASKRSTFKKMLRDMAKKLCRKYNPQAEERLVNNGGVVLAGQQPTAAFTGRLTRQTGRIKVMTQIGSPQLSQTPKRNALKRYKNPSVEMDDCARRREQCFGGLIVCRVNPDIVNSQPNADERPNGGTSTCVVCK